MTRARRVAMDSALGEPMGIVVSITDDYVQPDSDIVLTIDFREGDGSAARPFAMAADLIRALENIDDALVKSVDSHIETALVVEDLQKSSIKVFLRNVLKHVDDDALKTLDWRPLVGQFLVKGKYAVIRWLDDKSPKMTDLTEELGKLAGEAAEINHLPLPAPPNPARLVQGMDEWQRAKAQFKDGEGLTITLGRTEYRVDTSERWLPSERVDDIAGERELISDQETILMVRKPDMLGKTAWQFRIGKKQLSLRIEDDEWLQDYWTRKVVLMPGDAMQVVLRTVSRFSESGELLETNQSIRRVVQIIPQPQGGQEVLDI